MFCRGEDAGAGAQCGQSGAASCLVGMCAAAVGVMALCSPGSRHAAVDAPDVAGREATRWGDEVQDDHGLVEGSNYKTAVMSAVADDDTVVRSRVLQSRESWAPRGLGTLVEAVVDPRHEANDMVVLLVAVSSASLRNCFYTTGPGPKIAR
jgi:hypothetical protein